MLTLPSLGPYATILLAVAICATISWAVTQGLRAVVLWWDATHHDMWWFNLVIRSIAIIAGAAVGYAIFLTHIGLLIGACSGILNTTVVAVIKARLAGLQPPPAATDELQRVQDVVQGVENIVNTVKPPDGPPPGGTT